MFIPNRMYEIIRKRLSFDVYKNATKRYDIIIAMKRFRFEEKILRIYYQKIFEFIGSIFLKWFFRPDIVLITKRNT